MKKIRYLLCLAAALTLSACLQVSAVQKQTIYNSSYVTFSPDKKAWTTNAGDRDYTWYDSGTKAVTGIQSSIRKPEAGEHYYKEERRGEVPIGFWQVNHRAAQCIHDLYPQKGAGYHGIEYGTKKCGRYYYSGWTPYCADCGDPLADMLMYMSREAAESIDYMYLGGQEDFAYYYLCPHCGNLEQGVSLGIHMCSAVSWNQYKVRYDPNAGGNQRGYMPDSAHMYNNAKEYEGKDVTPVTHLTKNAYARIGYEFTGWNTKPDGSGTAYADEAEILNLSSADCNHSATWTETDTGIVTLYAQWRHSSSILYIDGNGGTYDGLGMYSIEDEYGNKYAVRNELIRPPAGFTVSFETAGGEQLPAVTGKRYFKEWSMTQPFQGRFLNGIYYFMASDGEADTLTAVYASAPIILPEPEKTGSSFGGWYYDGEHTVPAGKAGDMIIPDKDITLYAQWVELVLFSEDNYTANGGKGAVDLSWTQADGRNKSYMLYQSRDNKTWTRINTAKDIGNENSVRESWNFTESAQKYTVPYTGLYTLTAQGAQGGGYKDLEGGRGGSVTGTFWLQQGEMITCNIGGQKGSNGGGAASMYGNGGGCTVISSDRKGTLLIAGGGGGASPSGKGGSGGSNAGVTGNKNISGAFGQNGMAGGGGGYQGGSAGELIVHLHEDGCMHRADLGYVYVDQNYNTQSVTNNISGWGLSGRRKAVGNSDDTILIPEGLGTECLIPTKGNKTMNIKLHANAWSAHAMDTYIAIEVYNAQKRLIYSYYADAASQEVNGRPGESWEEDDGWHGTPDVFDIDTTLTVDVSKTEGVWIIYTIGTKYAGSDGKWAACHYAFHIYSVSFAGNTVTYPVCGYRDGQVLSSKPAYGGSNYINTAYVSNYTDIAGIRAGNGTAAIRSDVIGFQENLSLKDVPALDLAAPDKIEKSTVTQEAFDGRLVKISWQEPKDKGTEYYHKAESFPAGSADLLCISNVTKNTLASGVSGYYFLLDESPGTNVYAANADFCSGSSRTVTVSGTAQYLHVAPVDVAGNIGETVHIPVDAEAVPWKLYTRQLVIQGGENIYAAGEEKTWYVRADGSTPFTLNHSAYLEGTASESYQPNYTIYRTESNGAVAQAVIKTPSAAVTADAVYMDAAELSYSVSGHMPLEQYPYSVTIRGDYNKRLEGIQKFTLNENVSGRRIRIVPVSGADSGLGIIYSDYGLDAKNSLTIIGDGEAPDINGLEILENRELIDRNKGSIVLTATAHDDLSGVKDFYLKICNRDNAIEKTYIPEADGSIRLEITKDEPVFSGDFDITVYASDHVGNKRELAYGATEFALQTEVERILEPKDPVFKRGESGVLKIVTWGYADRVEVEFPQELVRLNPQLNSVYLYTDRPGYRQEEQLQFMIPLYAPENKTYEITVRAYKGDKRLEDFPAFGIIEVEGSVLQDFRTRLR
nr:InlB B-repeat-containing protein [uncultured Acetatifactor sp.]